MMAEKNTDNDIPPKKTVTSKEKERAARLKSIYQRKKTDLGLNETRLGEMLGISQSAVNKYLNGYVPMNVEYLMKFTKILGVDPHDIDPDLDNRFRVIAINTKDKLALTISGTNSGAYTPQQTVSVIGTRFMPHQMAVVMDTKAFEPIISEGTRIIVDPHKRLKVGQSIMVQFRFDNKNVPFGMVGRNDEGIEVVAYAIRPGFDPDKTEHPEWFPMEPRFIPYEEISSIRPIIGTDSRPPEYE